MMRAPWRERPLATVLVVEDEPALRETIAYRLHAAGHRAVLAPDGVDAIRLARQEDPDVVLLDLLLPRLPGFEVLRMLRRDSTAPIIVLSALDGEPDKVAAFEAGADDYVTKPFSFRELLARVSRQLERHAGQHRDRDVLVHGPIRVDPASREVRRGDELVALTPKEFDLLVYLMRHAGLVRSRDAILEAVWEGDFHGGTRTVDVHVHGLRRKLEDDPAHPSHLLTERSYGYKWAASNGPRARRQARSERG